MQTTHATPSANLVIQNRRLLAAFVVAAVACSPAIGGVIDDAKFKLDMRGGDPNGNAFVDSGEVVNAYDSAQTAVLGGGQGASRITAEQYASGGYDSYGELPHVGDVSVVNPADGSTYTQKCLILPQSKKTVGSDAYWSENGIVFTQSAVTPGDDGFFTIYARFKWDGNTSSPNLLVGNGWDGGYGNTDNGLSIYLNGEGKVGIVHNNSMGSSPVTCGANVWCDLFVVSRNEIINGAEKAVSDITLYKANSGSAPSLVTGSYTNKPMVFSSSKTRVTLGCYLTANGWAKKTNPRAFKGTIADVMIWDRAITAAEMAEIMAGTGSLGGEWQIGALNGSADEFGDGDPADIFDVQTMPWSRMRKTLDSSNPSLALAMTMTSSEHQMDRALSFTPILSGTGATVPVEVALNGTSVGEIDLAATTSITLPKELWRHDGTANTIAVSRTGTSSGTVQFDAISLAPAPSATSVLDDASFKLDLRGGASTYTQPGDLGNAFTFSSANPIVGYMGDQRGPRTYTSSYGNLPAQETAAVTNPYYPYTTNTQTVLHFYQDQKSATTSVRSSIVIPGAAPHGPVQTFYVRFRWDGKTPATTDNPTYVFQSGNADNGYSTKGVAMYITQYSVSDDLSTTNAYIGVRGSNSNGSLDNLVVKAGEWNDVFMTFSQNAANTAYTATGTLCKPAASGASNFSPPSLTTQSRTWSKPLLFNTANLTIGGYHESSGGATPTRAFRGLIADFMVWDRALTDDEKIEVMAGQHGAKWRIGAINGSADEFTDTDPAAVFEPQSMPWRQMRKTLDASNPTLTLKSPLATFEANKPMILHVDPIFTGTGASVPVSVAVNGKAIGSFDLAKKRNFLIEKRFWQRDAGGNVTVALSRTETTGSVAIDALSLSGSWQLQNETGNKMLNEAYAPNHYFAGDPVASHMGDSFSRGKGHVAYTFGVWVPSNLGPGYSWRFFAKTTALYASVLPGDRRFTLSVNGTLQTTVEGLANNGTYSIDIPEGILRPGMNMVQFRQTVPTSGTDWSYYGPWGMKLVPPPSAFIMVVR